MAKQGGDSKPNAGGFAFAKNLNPVAETEEMKAGQDSPVDISLTGPAELHQEPIQIPDGPVNKAKLDALAFNEEKITVMVHESDDPHAEQLIEVGVNGKKQFFKRGVQQVVRRKFVEALARAKATNYSQKVDDPNPLVVNRLMPRTALRYPFSLIRDDNPRGGHAWLQQLLAQGR